jgi:hypothetical protein
MPLPRPLPNAAGLAGPSAACGRAARLDGLRRA